MGRNVYIAYALFVLGALFGGGFHRIYCGKIFSGLAQIGLWWFAWLLYFTLIGIIIAVPLLLWWGFWMLLDMFSVNDWVDEINQERGNHMSYSQKLEAVDGLYELYKKGAISKEEFEARKDILMR